MKVLAALLLAGTIFGVVYGAAATLGTGTSFISAGNASVASCETGSVTGAPHLSNGTLVDGVTVSGLDPQCGGKAISVTLTGSNGTASLMSLSGVVPQGGGDVSLTGSTPVAATAVSGVSVAIQG
ncbi:MAG: hypothetical protein ABUS54_12885 [Actinomycetota bacterium]